MTSRIDYDKGVVENAQAKLAECAYKDRFDIMQADIRFSGNALDGPFDIATLFHNIYYFDEKERLQLCRDVQSRLSEIFIPESSIFYSFF